MYGPMFFQLNRGYKFSRELAGLLGMAKIVPLCHSHQVSGSKCRVRRIITGTHSSFCQMEFLQRMPWFFALVHFSGEVMDIAKA